MKTRMIPFYFCNSSKQKLKIKNKKLCCGQNDFYKSIDVSIAHAIPVFLIVIVLNAFYIALNLVI